MDESIVSIVRADNYDHDEIHRAAVKGLELIGGLAKIVSPGSKVLVKINHVSPPSSAEKGLVTHPTFVEVILDLLKEVGADITVGDDIESNSGDGFRVSGFRQMCERVGVRLINLRQAGFIEINCKGHFLEKIHLSRLAVDADVIVNLPKLKTHSLTILTGGVKNMYGTIPGGLRRKFHGDYGRSEDFSQVLTDIFSVVKPQLTVMDGVIAMEGEGPASGSLRKLGIILTSHDTVALDAVATRIIGLEPMDIHTTRYCHTRDLGVGSIKDIKVVGEIIERVTIADFRPPASASSALIRRMPQFLSRFILDQLSIRPYVIEDNCTGCIECEKICPIQAVAVNDKLARINRDICIQCMCCHEVCRFSAITVKQSVIGRVIQLLARSIRQLMATR